MLKKDQIKEVFDILATHIKEPKTELNFTNNFTMLIAVMLSAQSTDKGVNKATESLFKAIDSPKDIIALGEEKLIDYIKSIGLYKTKAKNILLMSQILINDYNSLVPNDFSSLVSLPGVGRKTANVILSTAFGIHTIAVDTHVFRLSKRLGLSNGKDVIQVEEDLMKKVPQEHKKDAHHLLILHGRYMCKAQGLNCSPCYLQHICQFKTKVFK
jgi:endonuclease-3